MVLTFDGDSDVSQASCEHCGTPYTLVTSFVLRDGTTYVVAKTALHRHDVAEAWIDVVFGSWEAEVGDHVTFGCRVGPVAGSRDPAATVVDAAVPYADTPFWGLKLSRSQALSHPMIREFWAVVDFLLLTEPALEHHVYHRRSPRKRWF